MERRFEEAWRKAFEGAEVQPSEKTWEAMESALIALENQRMKRKVVFYQRLAAASVLFAILLGAFGYYSWRNRTSGGVELAARHQALPAESVPQQAAPALQKNQDLTNRKSAVASTVESRVNKTNATPVSKNNMAGVDLHAAAIKPLPADSIAVREENPVTQLVSVPLSNTSETGTGKQAVTANAEESPVKIQKKEEPTIAMQDLLAKKENEKEAVKSARYEEDLWASLNVAAGNYNSGALSPAYSPVAAASNGGPTTMSFGGPSVSRSPVGSARSVGVTLGKRVTRRWVILSGVNYLNQTSGYTSNSSNQGQAYLANFGTLKSASSVTYTNPYPINSVLEFISVPLQAGYLIVDHKVGLQMNAGVSTDFLLRNTLQDPSGQVNSYSQSAGADSPYRSVNWAGLVSTELSYRLASQYRVSIVPGVRYFFNPAFKSGSSDHPYVTDIGFRFRYILR